MGGPCVSQRQASMLPMSNLAAFRSPTPTIWLRFVHCRIVCHPFANHPPGSGPSPKWGPLGSLRCGQTCPPEGSLPRESTRPFQFQSGRPRPRPTFTVTHLLPLRVDSTQVPVWFVCYHCVTNGLSPAPEFACFSCIPYHSFCCCLAAAPPHPCLVRCCFCDRGRGRGCVSASTLTWPP